MRKISMLLLSVVLIFLGCTKEKTIRIPHSDADALFAKSQIVLKKEMPAARMSADISNRVLKVNNDHNNDYPNFIELSFSKDKGGTLLKTIVSDDSDQKIENLAFLFKKELQKQNTLNALGKKIKNFAKPNFEKIKPHKVRNEFDKKIDKNQDGWIDKFEIQKFKRNLNKKRKF